MLHSKRKNTLNRRKRSNNQRNGRGQKRLLIGGLIDKGLYAEVAPSAGELKDVWENSDVKLVKELIDEHRNDHNYIKTITVNLHSARQLIEDVMDEGYGNSYLYKTKDNVIELMNYVLRK